MTSSRYFKSKNNVVALFNFSIYARPVQIDSLKKRKFEVSFEAINNNLKIFFRLKINKI